MSKSEYAQKLKDPRWQKRRLEILERDRWECQQCFSSQSTLHVHHRYYVEVGEPWDYPGSALVTLCEECHECEGRYMPGASRVLINALKSGGMLATDIQSMGLQIAKALGEKSFPQWYWDAIAWKFAQLLASDELIEAARDEYAAAMKALQAED